MTHWSTRSLAVVARQRGIAPTLSHSTVALILRDAELQPHRSRYWKTPTLDDTFRRKAAQVLWCYEHAQRLETRDLLLSRYPRVRMLFTPAHASWLNQAELLLRAFTEHYLRRAEWASRDEFIEHLAASWPEYNRLFAYPFTWSWTRAKMHAWMDRHQS